MRLGVILGLTTLFSSSIAQRLVCYYGSWAVYRHGPGKFGVENIDPNLCTHIIYAFVGLNYDGKVKILDHYNDIGDDWKEGAYKKLQKLKERNPNVKNLIAIGGWNEGSTTYSRVVNDPNLRKIMVNSILEFTLKHKFDGFDLDWEYPNQRGGIPSDKEAFSALIAEIKEAFRPHGLILTAAVSANALTSPGSYNCKDLATYLDFISVMTYDLHGSWETVTGHHTAMYAHPKDGPKDQHLNVDTAIKYWIQCTGAPQKLNIGLATYGRTFTLADRNRHEIGSPVTGPGPAGSYVGENGFLGFNEICKEQTQGLWTVYPVPEQEVKYAVKNNIWVGYDDIESITKKMEYWKSLNLGGAMVWSVETDDFRGECGMGKFPLLTTIKNMLNLPNVSTPRPPSTQQPPSTRPPTQSPPTQRPPTQQPPTQRPPTQNPPTHRPPPPSDDYDHMCTFCGQYFRHPHDSSAFFQCTYSGIGLQLRAVYMRCPNDLVFDERYNVCNHPNEL